jgi:circadian clock protein KaiC
MLNGGFLPGDAIMVAGAAGTGKTTLALQYLVNGINLSKQNGLYITFEQIPNQIYRDAKSFGWDLKRMEEQKKIKVICTSPDILLEEEGRDAVLGEAIKEIHPSRVVIDSLSHLSMYIGEKDFRKEMYRLLMALKTQGLSSINLWEAPQVTGESISITDVGSSFLVDCVILLRFVEIQSTMKKAINVIKMRGSNHDKRLREYEITGTGLQVMSAFTNYEGVLTGSPRKVAEGRFVDLLGSTAKNK